MCGVRLCFSSQANTCLMLAPGYAQGRQLWGTTCPSTCSLSSVDNSVNVSSRISYLCCPPTVGALKIQSGSRSRLPWHWQWQSPKRVIPACTPNSSEYLGAEETKAKQCRPAGSLMWTKWPMKGSTSSNVLITVEIAAAMECAPVSSADTGRPASILMGSDDLISLIVLGELIINRAQQGKKEGMHKATCRDQSPIELTSASACARVPSATQQMETKTPLFSSAVVRPADLVPGTLVRVVRTPFTEMYCERLIGKYGCVLVVHATHTGAATGHAVGVAFANAPSYLLLDANVQVVPPMDVLATLDFAATAIHHQNDDDQAAADVPGCPPRRRKVVYESPAAQRSPGRAPLLHDHVEVVRSVRCDLVGQTARIVTVPVHPNTWFGIGLDLDASQHKVRAPDLRLVPHEPTLSDGLSGARVAPFSSTESSSSGSQRSTHAMIPAPSLSSQRQPDRATAIASAPPTVAAENLGTAGLGMAAPASARVENHHHQAGGSRKRKVPPTEALVLSPSKGSAFTACKRARVDSVAVV